MEGLNANRASRIGKSLSSHRNSTNIQPSLGHTSLDFSADVRVLLETLTTREGFADSTNIIARLLSLPDEEWKALEFLRASPAARPLLKEYFPQLHFNICDEIWSDLVSIQAMSQWNEVREFVVDKIRCGVLFLYLVETSCQFSGVASSTNSQSSAPTTPSSARESLRSSLTSNLSRNCSLRTMQSIDENDQEPDNNHETIDTKEAISEFVGRKRSLSNDAKRAIKKQSYTCQVSDCRQRPYIRVKDLTNHFNNNHRAIFKDKTADEMDKIARGELNLYDGHEVKAENKNNSSFQKHVPDTMLTDAQRQNQDSSLQTSDGGKLYQGSTNNSYLPLGREVEAYWSQQIGIPEPVPDLQSQPTFTACPQAHNFDVPMADISENHQRNPSFSDWLHFDLGSQPTPPPNGSQSYARLGHRSLRDSMHIHPFRVSQ